MTSDESKLLAPFGRPIKQVRLRPAYRALLILVALFMVLLPLAYVAFVGGAMWATVWFLFAGWEWLIAVSGFIKLLL